MGPSFETIQSKHDTTPQVSTHGGDLLPSTTIQTSPREAPFDAIRIGDHRGAILIIRWDITKVIGDKILEGTPKAEVEGGEGGNGFGI